MQRLGFGKSFVNPAFTLRTKVETVPSVRIPTVPLIHRHLRETLVPYRPRRLIDFSVDGSRFYFEDIGSVKLRHCWILTDRIFYPLSVGGTDTLPSGNADKVSGPNEMLSLYHDLPAKAH